VSATQRPNGHRWDGEEERRAAAASARVSAAAQLAMRLTSVARRGGAARQRVIGSVRAVMLAGGACGAQRREGGEALSHCGLRWGEALSHSA